MGEKKPISIEELLNKMDDSTCRRYKVHDNKGNCKWEKDISYSLGRCSWMGEEQDVMDYIEYVNEHPLE